MSDDMKSDDDVPLDLRALRIPAQPDSSGDEDAFVAGVMNAVRQREAPIVGIDPLLGLRDLAVPFLAAASLAVAAALVWRDRADVAQHQPRTVAEALGVPPEFLVDASRRTGGR